MHAICSVRLILLWPEWPAQERRESLLKVLSAYTMLHHVLKVLWGYILYLSLLPYQIGISCKLGIILGNGNPLQYSCLGNPWMENPGRLQSMESQSWTQVSNFTSFFPTFYWRKEGWKEDREIEQMTLSHSHFTWWDMRKNEIEIRIYSGLAISNKETGRLKGMGLKGLF